MLVTHTQIINYIRRQKHIQHDQFNIIFTRRWFGFSYNGQVKIKNKN